MGIDIDNLRLMVATGAEITFGADDAKVLSATLDTLTRDCASLRLSLEAAQRERDAQNKRADVPQARLLTPELKEEHALRLAAESQRDRAVARLKQVLDAYERRRTGFPLDYEAETAIIETAALLAEHL